MDTDVAELGSLVINNQASSVGHLGEGLHLSLRGTARLSTRTALAVHGKEPMDEV